MADILHAPYLDDVAIFLACNPFILLGIAWLALRPRRGAHTLFWHDGSGQLKGRSPLPMPKASGR